MERLETITALSHAFGTDRYVKGGGGNTSAKDDKTLWVKPSGTTLAGLKPETFVALDRERIDILYETPTPAEAGAREALVKDLMDAAVRDPSAGRPSVEAPLHNALEAVYVVHTHPAWVNGMTCAVGGEAFCREHFPDALWVEYIDPGYTLCMEARRRLQAYARRHGRQPAILVLQNHGVFVAGDTPAEIESHYARLMNTLESAYAAAGVSVDMPAAGTHADPGLAGRLRACFGDAAAHVAGGGRFSPPEGPLTPDHLVYARAFPFTGDLTPAAAADYRSRYGFAPKVAVVDGRVYGLGTTAGAAERAWIFALDGAQVCRLAAAFGGVCWMSERARLFIENWEVESYRQSVATA